MLSITNAVNFHSEEHTRSGRVRAHLAEVLKSAPFRRAPGLRKLLEFVVDSTLAGEGDTLKEYTLGADGLSRGTDFDPRFDPIVRVQMRKVRMRLNRYYAETASEHPLRIEIRSGRYRPHFQFAEDRTQPNTEWTVMPAPRPQPFAEVFARRAAMGM